MKERLTYRASVRYDITSEAHLEKFLLKNFDQFFPGYVVTKLRKKIARGSIVDIIASDERGEILIELKFRPMRRSDMAQINRYARAMTETTGFAPRERILVDYDHLHQLIGFYAV